MTTLSIHNPRPASPPVPVANLFCGPAWLDTLRAAFPALDFSFAAGIPCARRDNLLGKHLLCLPFSDYLDPALPSDDLLTALHRLTADHPDYAISLRLAGRLPDHPRWQPSRRGFYHLVPVASESTMWPRLSPAFRRAVRKAQKHHLAVEFSHDLESLDAFYNLFVHHRQHKFRILSPPRALFHAIHERFFRPDRGFVLHATRDRQPLAALLVLAHRDTLYYKFGASRLDALDSRPNNLLFWRLLQYAHEHDFAAVNLGLTWDSPDDLGLARFKASLGAAAHPVTHYRYTPPTFDRAREHHYRTLLRRLTAALVAQPHTPDQHDQLARLLFHYFT